MQGVVGTVRLPVFWFQVEPLPGQYDFSALDETVNGAAERGIRILPFVYGSPSWVSAQPAFPPLATASARRAWISFLGHLVERYGAGGSFWRGKSVKRPIRRWQIWNEPNFLLFWRPRPSPARYARLLRLSARSIRRRDPGARIVAAGVAPVEAGILPWEFLRRMYRVPGVRRSFDVAALHPYATSLRAMEYEIRHVRRAMAGGGDAATSLQLTEVGIASSGAYRNPFDRGLHGQARFLRRAYGLLRDNRRRWRLAGIDWFTWQDAPAPDPHCVFCQYAGLFDLEGAPKPAWWAFRSALAAAAKPVR
jgi:hypothetical protein